jgi:hypothetical protein
MLEKATSHIFSGVKTRTELKVVVLIYFPDKLTSFPVKQ